MIPQTVGQYRLRQMFPPDVEIPTTLDKKGIGSLFAQVAEKHPDKYVDILKHYNDTARYAATRYGRFTSISVNDLKATPKIKAMQKQVSEDIEDIKQDTTLTPEQKQKKIVDYMQARIKPIQDMVVEETSKAGSSLGIAVKHGFRANPLQLTQLFFGDLLVADHRDRPIPIAAIHGYNQGVTPMEYLAGAFGARKGAWSVQSATAKSGYMAKKVAYMAHRVRVTGEDCGARNVGLTAEGDDPGNIGAVLARPEGPFQVGHIITKKDLPALAGKNVLVRSLITCQQQDGVCQRCAGIRDKGDFPELGAYLGIESARFITEPATQGLALSVKHSGGVASKKHSDISGLAEVSQFIDIPDRFRGGATLAPTDGVVQEIRKAPQGGHYIRVGNGDEMYVPTERTITVNKGDTVEAGDSLTDGTPSPKEIAEYKGLGAGRAYFVKQYGNILANNGIPAERRHVETIARPFFDRVLINDPDGFMGYDIGDIVPYSAVANKYKPRKDASAMSPSTAIHQYLEEPVLHYTIGTRITPSVIKDLNDAKVKQVAVHKDPPPFEPEILRAMDVTSTDPDWQTRLVGFGLRKSYIQAATHGADSDPQGTSYVPKLIKPTEL